MYPDNFSAGAQAADRLRFGRRAGIVGIVCNALLCAGKLTVGILAGSVCIRADAVNNLSDAASSLMTLLSFHLAAKPADEEHPYGHDRIEYLSALAVAVLILVIGVELLKNSVEKILHPAPVEFSAVTAAVLLGSIALKLWLAAYNAGLGRKIGSQALTAAAADARNDAIATSAVLIACVFAELSDVMIDGYVGVAAAGFILFSGVQIAKETVDPLLGQAPDEELIDALAELMHSDELVLGIHDLLVHDYGPGRRFASAHAEIDARVDVLLAHEHIDELELRAGRELKLELVIHYDPIVTDDEELNVIHEKLRDYLSRKDERLTMHDLRMVRGMKQNRVLFDLAIPFELEDRKDELKDEICEMLRQGECACGAQIHFDGEMYCNPTAPRKKGKRPDSGRTGGGGKGE